MDVFNFFSEPIKNVLDHLRYIIQVEDNVKTLTHKAQNLEHKRKDVEEQIEKDEAERKRPKHEVKGWLERTKELHTVAQSIKTDYDSRNMLLGTFSFNYFSIYSIGKRAVEELGKVNDELGFINNSEDYTVAVRPPAVQYISAPLIKFGRETLESQTNQALNFLKEDNNERGGVLGIWGMGGVGKTTLLLHINNTLEENPLTSFGFDKVVFVTASRKCPIEKIQEEIMEKLGLSKGRSNTNHLTNYLRNKSFAVLLDDLWEPLQLEEIGIPLPLGLVDGKYKRKLILTSRCEDVCLKMEAKAALIKVDCLNREDARRLFGSKVGDEVIQANEAILELANRAADLCDGLPVALNTIGRAMAGTTDIKVWENALDELKESRSKFFMTHDISGTKRNPLPLLKFSYDHLKDPAKQECFLLCALWPEDAEIEKEEVIECWIGHGLLGEVDDIRKAYRRGHAMIYSLQKACLLETGRYSHCVKLHDVIRDMAMWIARDCGQNENKWVVLSGNAEKEAPRDKKLWIKVHKMSITWTEITSLRSKKCPNLTTLILKENHNLKGEDMINFKHLNAVKYLDLTNTKTERLPAEIGSLNKLEYFNLSQTGYLSLSRTGITSLPMELKCLVNLKFLFLEGNKVSTIDALPHLVSLLELRLFSPKQSDPQSMIIDQLDCLKEHLKALTINVSSIWDLQKLVRLSGTFVRRLCIKGLQGLSSHSLELMSPDFLGSKHMHFHLKELFLRMRGFGPVVEELVLEGNGRFSSLERLSIDGGNKAFKEIIWKEVEPEELFPMLRDIHISACKLEHVTWILNLQCLVALCLEACENMKQLVIWEHAVKTEKPFADLRVLRLLNLPQLSSICDRASTFPSLECLEVLGCRNLKKLPFHLPIHCSKLGEILGGTDWWENLELEDNMRAFLQPLFNEYEDEDEDL